MPSPEDDDKTVIKPKTSLVSAPTGIRPNAIQPDSPTLPIGVNIAEFEITGIIGIGGFGIVYLAHDHSLGRDVALKEYMPSSLASRTDGITVSAKSQQCAETFSVGLRSFINEARLLARFDHPSLVKVYRFWEDNGTAYMVMPYYDGMTLKETLQKMASPPSEAWLKMLLIPLMEALQHIHRESCFHRDIAPDNILLLKNGQPVLLDFGAARLVIGDMDKNLTVILKPGFAPVEQYADIPGLHQGAWTDIYALAAVVHYAITGKQPPVSIGRIVNDTAIPLAEAAALRYSDVFLRGLDRALAVRPEHRPQSIAELRQLLVLDDDPIEQPVLKQSDTAARLPNKPVGTLTTGLLVLLVGASSILGIGAYFVLKPTPVVLKPVPLPIPVVNPPTVSKPLIALTPSDVASPQPMVQGIPDAMDAFVQLYDRRDRDHEVSVRLDRLRLKIGKDNLRFRIKSSKDGYLYIMMIGTQNEHLLIFPNEMDKDNKIAADTEISFPRNEIDMPVTGPPGTDQFIAVVSEQAHDFTEKSTSAAGGFGEFSPAQATSFLELLPDTVLTNGRKPICPSVGKCSNTYGAVRFSIEEIN